MIVAIHTDFGSVVDGAKDEFRGAVITGANVRYIWLSFDEILGRAEVTQLKHARVWIEEQILRLNVTMANSLMVKIRKRPEKLIHVQLKCIQCKYLSNFTHIPS